MGPFSGLSSLLVSTIGGVKKVVTVLSVLRASYRTTQISYIPPRCSDGSNIAYPHVPDGLATYTVGKHIATVAPDRA